MWNDLEHLNPAPLPKAFASFDYLSLYLVNAEHISYVELFPFFFVPAFCLGFVTSLFDKAERAGMSKEVRETVRESWKMRDRGVKRSWDWGIYSGR
jgi:hypothetical protein